MTVFSDICCQCQKSLPAGVTVCPACGEEVTRPNPADALPVGTLLSERYAVGRLLEMAGDAAVYNGYDTVLKAPIRVREYWPRELCVRTPEGTLQPKEDCETVVAEYLSAYLSHARTVARLRDLPSSIPVYDIFQHNATAYTVSERCDGPSLAQFLAQNGGRLPWEQVRPLFMPLMTSLIALHKAGVYHLGLCPENLLFGADGKLHLEGLATGFARTSNSELSPQLYSGYAAPEQYVAGAMPGAAADVYGLAAVIFRTLVGNPPPDGQQRPQTNSDLTVPAEVAGELPPHVASALFHALQPSTEKRIGSIALLQERLAAAPAVAALLQDEEPAPTVSPVAETAAEPAEPEEPPKSHRTLYAVLIVLAVVLAIAGLAVLCLRWLFPPDTDTPDDSSPTTTTVSGVVTEVTTTRQDSVLLSVPNVVGRSYYDIRGKQVEDRTVLLEGLAYSDTVPAGVVLSQSPTAEEKAEIQTPIKVIISAGPELVSIPDVTGWPLDYAAEYLQALGFQVQIDEVAVSAQEAGMVDSTSPVRGNKLARGNVVRIRVSTATTATTPSATATAPTPSTTAPSIDD